MFCFSVFKTEKLNWYFLVIYLFNSCNAPSFQMHLYGGKYWTAKKKRRNLIRPLGESNPRCRSYKADPLLMSHRVIDTYNGEKTYKYTYRKRDKELTQIQSWLEESFDHAWSQQTSNTIWWCFSFLRVQKRLLKNISVLPWTLKVKRKSVIFSPKRGDENTCPFHIRILPLVIDLWNKNELQC